MVYTNQQLKIKHSILTLQPYAGTEVAKGRTDNTDHVSQFSKKVSKLKMKINV